MILYIQAYDVVHGIEARYVETAGEHGTRREIIFKQTTN